MRRREDQPKFFPCPNCGADVPIKALACPSCGSDDETGWSEEAKYVHLLPQQEEPLVRRVSLWRVVGIPAIAFVLAFASLVTTGLPWRICLVLLLALAAVYYVFQGNTNLFGGDERRFYAQLLERARGDRGLAERLIAYEAQRSPEQTRVQHIRDAIDRWERDRR